jgi:hypothetical protein
LISDKDSIVIIIVSNWSVVNSKNRLTKLSEALSSPGAIINVLAKKSINNRPSIKNNFVSGTWKIPELKSAIWHKIIIKVISRKFFL